MTVDGGRVDIQVRLDLIVETLMGAIALGVPRLPDAGRFNHPIRRRAVGRWRDLREHEAARLGKRLLGRRFWIDDLCCLAAALVQVENQRLIPRFDGPRQNGADVIQACDRLAEALCDFSGRADIAQVLNEAQALPGQVLEAVGGVGEIESWVQRARRLLGPGPEHICIFPSPLCAPDLAFGPTVLTGRGQEAWVIFGPVWDFNDRPWRMSGFGGPKLGRVIRHEIGHSHLNPHTRAAAALVNDFAGLYAPMKPAMQALGYKSWEICLNELILRATEVLYIAGQEGARSAQRQLLREEKKGFTLIRPAIESLQEIGDSSVRDGLAAFLCALKRNARGGEV